jgi:hypothetical protein
LRNKKTRKNEKINCCSCNSAFTLSFAQETPKKSCCSDKAKKECSTKDKKACSDKDKKACTDKDKKACNAKDKKSCCATKKAA